ncbi:hypothetical protein DFH08DRAFT_807287 [Mycena albidolilacea]|uniref:Uncharacterized protein n=1 Tax=Mycena albidolilacea TaxID=1033008 RepID=A0AAD7EUC0_9AGAR|nr:hypothetical protein DFH08DRAFT_807287 [Mycena albidolilacea]
MTKSLCLTLSPGWALLTIMSKIHERYEGIIAANSAAKVEWNCGHTGCVGTFGGKYGQEKPESLSAAYEADRGRHERARSAHEKLKTKANRANSTEKHIVDIVYRPIYLWGHEKYMTTYRDLRTILWLVEKEWSKPKDTNNPLMTQNPHFYADNMISELERVGRVEPKPFTDNITKMAKFVVYPDRFCRLNISAGGHNQEPALVEFGNICRRTETSFILKGNFEQPRMRAVFITFFLDARGILWNTRMIAFWDSESTGEHRQFQVEGVGQPYTWSGLLLAWDSQRSHGLFEVKTQMRQRNPPTNIGNLSQWFSKTFSPGVHESQVKNALAETIDDIVRDLETHSAHSERLPSAVRAALNYERNPLNRTDIVFKFLSSPEATADHIKCFQEALAKVGGPGIEGMLPDIESQKESGQNPRGTLGPSQNERIASRLVPPAVPDAGRNPAPRKSESVLHQAGGSGIIRDTKASHSEPKAPEKARGHDDSPEKSHSQSTGTTKPAALSCKANSGVAAGPKKPVETTVQTTHERHIPLPTHRGTARSEAVHEIAGPLLKTPAVPTDLGPAPQRSELRGADGSEKPPEKAPRESGLPRESQPVPSTQTGKSISTAVSEGAILTSLAAGPKKQQGQHVATQPKTTPTQVQGELVASKQGPPVPAPAKSEWWLRKWAKKAAGYVGLT